ncbi:carbohydrate ABC transporter permease [Undibacterium squillarum]|uniref:Lactose ABC transporter permease n=1 Tax=Undibacterium squillarum TaxID=1131567 RepID=A0ABQ2Y0R0_9BURK|nr:sugar ABC transporter permease [Undibacterium squillarum]GGX43827.1 lactose ABC transporter permease [Undibacterium squillarum]
MFRLLRWQSLVPWFFLFPALMIFAAFAFWPVLAGAWFSLTDYRLLHTPQFVGLDNYRALLNNPLFLTGLRNSFLFLLVVPFTQIAALALAVLVNQPLRGIHWFRTVFYLPVVTTVSVVGILWGFMFHEQGTLNYVLLQLKLIHTPLGWLSDDHLALAAVMFVCFWRGLGWYMVMYLAALQAVPADLYEAAELDGAGRWARFRYITVPALYPVIAMCTVMSVLAALKAYQEVDVLTQGGPMNSTFTALYYAYDQGLKHLRIPRGLAASFIVSLICMAIALSGLWLLRPGSKR